MFTQPDRKVVCELIGKLQKLVFPGYYRDYAYRGYNPANNLSALVELGQVRSGEHPAGVLLMPTPEGLQALEAFTGRIPASRRETIDQTAAAWRDICRRELERPALAEKQADGTTRLRLLLV